MKLQEALELTAKVLVKTMDTASPTAERLEFGIVPGKKEWLKGWLNRMEEILHHLG